MRRRLAVLMTVCAVAVCAVLAGMTVAGRALAATGAAGRPGGGGTPAGALAARAPSAERAPRALLITTAALPSGIRGLSYLTLLTASGGVAPYSWSASGLPAGLTVTPAGVIAGYPLATGSRLVRVTVRDARGVTVRAALPLAVPSSLPDACVARTCSLLSADAYTVAVPAAAVRSVTRSASTGPVTGVLLSSAGGFTVGSVVAGDILVLPAAAAIPSGLIAVAGSVTVTNGHALVVVRTATPADAYDRGVVQTVGSGANTATAGTGMAGTRPASAGKVSAGTASAGTTGLSCGGGVTGTVHGLAVSPALTPEIGLLWQHARDANPGVHPGPGGLSLFQFTLSGTIAVNLGVSVSGAANCAMTLPAVVRTMSAGGLGTVVLRLTPTLHLATTRELDVAASATLTCYAGYRWDAGTAIAAAYCTAHRGALEFSSLSAATATVTGTIAASASLDDLPLVAGTATAALQAGYHPAGQPVARLGASTGYDLTAPLAGLWAGAPAVTVARGTVFDAVLATWITRPASATGPTRLAVTPATAFPWSDAVCGYDTPSFGANTVAVAGRGFEPGETATISPGWTSSRAQVTAASGGTFTHRVPVGEVPGVLGTLFRVTARGTAGSSAAGSVTLDPNACLLQTDGDGQLTLRWGANGFDPRTRVSLSVNGHAVSTAVTDSRGSGGTSYAFTCPATGGYTWQVTGTADRTPIAAGATLTCTLATAFPRFGENTVTQASAPAASTD
jgi:hypothetical protein